MEPTAIRHTPALGTTIQAAILFALSLQPLCLRSANADEKAPISARFGQISANSGIIAPHTVDIRINGGSDYVVTASGSIVPAQSPIVASVDDTKQSQIALGHGSAITNLTRSAEDNIFNQIGNTNTNLGSGQLDTDDECGPSPFTAEDIRALVVEAAQRHGVDEALAVAVATVESDLDRNRNSAAGARGPMQLMPATAARFGLADPCDPTANIDAGVRYLGLLLDQFKNPILAVAAYNAGEEHIYKYGGVPPFPETVNYVAKVVNHQFGLPALHPMSARTSQSNHSAAPALDGVVIVPDKRRQWVAGVMQF